MHSCQKLKLDAAQMLQYMIPLENLKRSEQLILSFISASTFLLVDRIPK